MAGRSSDNQHCKLILIVSSITLLIFKYMSNCQVTFGRKSKPAFSGVLFFILHAK